MKNKDLKRRIIDISYRLKLAHIGSCLTAVDIIEDIYSRKKSSEKFVLSSGHAGLGLYVVLEKYTKKSAEEIYLHHGTHPDRCKDCGIDCSTGSLGQGLPIAVGMALANPKKNVYVLCSDGEWAEGSIYESLNIVRDQNIKNIKIHLNHNGWAAYKPVHYLEVPKFVKLHVTNVDEFPYLIGQIGHYKILTEEQYKHAMEVLK